MHPSPLALEQLLAGQGDPQTTSHLLACEACRERLTTMERAARTFSSSPRSLQAKAAAERADRRWKLRAFAFTATPVALAGVLLVATLASREPGPAKRPIVAQSATPRLRQGREVLEPRPGAWSPRLRSLSLRGRQVEFGQGSLEATAGDGPTRPFTLTHTKVDIAVTGFMQAVTVTQTFRNPFPQPVEAVYVFPLPDDSAVHDMTLKAGARVIQATVQKRAEARQRYEEAKAQGRRAALLDQERPNIFTQSLANLLPGEKVEVTLQYVAPVHYDDGVYTLNFPMVVGPRYVPGATLPGENQGSGTSDDTDVVPDASRISPPVARSGRDVEVRVHLDSGTVIEDLWSVSHALEVDRPSSSVVDLSLHPLDTLPNKDLIVRWRVSGPQARAAMLASGGAFALMLNPEARDAHLPATPKEMVFVIDTSGSMQGAPLAAAKRAMTLALEQMSPDDTFMLIDFADRASSFHDAALPATAENVQRAQRYLAALPAGGGTNQLAGLRRALDRPEDPRRLRMVLLMTDGFIGNEEEILEQAGLFRGHARIFGFGVGSSVNHFLLSRLSEEGRGFYQYVRPDEDPTAAVERFTRRVRRPLITDVTVDWGGLPVADVLPEPLVDLFDAQPLIIQGRYRGEAKGTVVLRGKRGAEPVTFEVPVTFPPASTGGRGLTMAWARARIEALSRVQHNREPPALVEQITTLGLEYHLVTKYTSLVAVELSSVTTIPALTVTEPTLAADQTQPDTGGALRGALGGRVGGSVRLSTLGNKGIGAGGGGTAGLGGVGTLGATRGSNGEGFDTVFGGDDFDSAFGANTGKGKGTGAKGHTGGYIPPPPGGAGGEVKESLGQSDVMEVVLAHRKELAACVERQQALDPSLHGKLVMRWSVTVNGLPTAISVVSPEFRNTDMARCVTQLLRTWRFPKHRTAGAPITMPFTF
ncbi:MAG: VIT domain-containing protein [Myxococcota bacterium]